MPAYPQSVPRTDHPAGHALAGPGESLLGFGPSGLVYGGLDKHGRPQSRKVFECDTLTRVVQYVTLGAAAPYAWNEHAVRAALLRRRILAQLVPFWFPDRLRVARAYAHGWDPRFRAFELRTEPINGRPPQLPHPLHPDGKGETRSLVRDILPKLQAHLEESGFDGLLWPAGRGNPVAGANFRLEQVSQDKLQWVWMDLESGVPAIFPLFLPALWRTYIPLCIKHGRILFDDVDEKRLASWIDGHAAALDACNGVGTTAGCQSDVAALAYHQECWRNQPRRAAAIDSQVAKGRINPTQAARYARSPLAWYGFEAGRLAHALGSRAFGFSKRQRSRLTLVPWKNLPAKGLRFCISQTYREHTARRLIHLRIKQWQARGQLSQSHAARLRKHATEDGPSAYLADFGVHLAIKPFVKAIEYLSMPVLWATGRIDETTLALALLLGGCLARTIYTAFRCGQEVLRGRNAPWLALTVGAVPVLGNLAFPLQIVHRSREESGLLARFLIFDACALIGRQLPIWGGRDTITEHALGGLARRLAATDSSTKP